MKRKGLVRAVLKNCLREEGSFPFQSTGDQIGPLPLPATLVLLAMLSMDPVCR